MRRLALAVVWAGFVARSAADMISVLDSLADRNSSDKHHFDTACALGNTETLQASFAIMLRDDNFVDPNSPLNDHGDTCLHLMLRAAAPGKTRRVRRGTGRRRCGGRALKFSRALAHGLVQQRRPEKDK